MLPYHYEVLYAGNRGPSTEVKHVSVDLSAPFGSFVLETQNCWFLLLLCLLKVNIVEILVLLLAFSRDESGDFARPLQSKNVGLVFNSDQLLSFFLRWISITSEIWRVLESAVELSAKEI